MSTSDRLCHVRATQHFGGALGLSPQFSKKVSIDIALAGVCITPAPRAGGGDTPRPVAAAGGAGGPQAPPALKPSEIRRYFGGFPSEVSEEGKPLDPRFSALRHSVFGLELVDGSLLVFECFDATQCCGVLSALAKATQRPVQPLPLMRAHQSNVASYLYGYLFDPARSRPGTAGTVPSRTRPAASDVAPPPPPVLARSRAVSGSGSAAAARVASPTAATTRSSAKPVAARPSVGARITALVPAGGRAKPSAEGDDADRVDAIVPARTASPGQRRVRVVAEPVESSPTVSEPSPARASPPRSALRSVSSATADPSPLSILSRPTSVATSPARTSFADRRGDPSASLSMSPSHPRPSNGAGDHRSNSAARAATSQSRSSSSQQQHATRPGSLSPQAESKIKILERQLEEATTKNLELEIDVAKFQARTLDLEEELKRARDETEAMRRRHSALEQTLKDNDALHQRELQREREELVASLQGDVTAHWESMQKKWREREREYKQRILELQSRLDEGSPSASP